jgi:hypothetical protein
MTRLPLLLLLTLGMFLAGCETWSGLFDPPAPEPVVIEVPASKPYLDLLSRLVTSEPEEQAQIYASIRVNLEADASPANQLKYALVLAAPGHAYSDATAAQSIFSTLLAEPKGLKPVELDIIRISMAYSQQWQNILAEQDGLSEQLASKDSAQQARDKQIKELQGAVASLRQQLKDAEEKLDAIANIERQMERPEPKQD